ncbi:MAG: hypothetical protein AAGB01_01865 [Cyanobacteria bacterium P01_F01_bin.42]
MASPDPPSLGQINLKFQQGQRYFESGRYREAIQSLSQACALVESSSKPAGEMRLWLVTAYDADGQRQEALSLCRQLAQSPFIDIRRQAKRLLTILEAPKLSLHEDWVTTIPPLDGVKDPGQMRGEARRVSPQRAPSPKPVINDQEVDLSQVTTSDRGLAIMAGILVVLLGLGLVWLA